MPGDFATALLAESMLAKEPGAKIIYDVRASLGGAETIQRAGGEPLMNRVGHAYIKHAHAQGRRRIRRRGVRPLLLPRVLAGRHGRRPVPAHARADLEERREAVRDPCAVPRAKYFITGEINTPVADVALKLQELKERYAREGTVSHLDGISVDADDWHFNVRPSNTEPLLRLNLEARSQSLMEAKRDEVLALIRS